jgi:hypothetical protein
MKIIHVPEQRDNIMNIMGKEFIRKMVEIQGLFAKFMDSPYYSKSELCRGVVMVSFSKYLPWQTMHYL